MRNIIHKIICIKVSRVIRIWSSPQDSIAVKSLYLFGRRLCDVETPKPSQTRYRSDKGRFLTEFQLIFLTPAVPMPRF